MWCCGRITTFREPQLPPSFHPENGDNKVLGNTGILLQHFMVLHPRRHQFEHVKIILTEIVFTNMIIRVSLFGKQWLYVRSRMMNVHLFGMCYVCCTSRMLSLTFTFCMCLHVIVSIHGNLHPYHSHVGD